jgi:hypothetical protein
MKGMTVITNFPRTSEHVLNYPITGDYDINIWCDNDDDTPKDEWRVHLTFYPLIKGGPYDRVDTSVFYTLAFKAFPIEPKEIDGLSYLERLVNKEDTFDVVYTDWWSNECVLSDAPEVITDYMKQLPREEN